MTRPFAVVEHPAPHQAHEHDDESQDDVVQGGVLPICKWTLYKVCSAKPECSIVLWYRLIILFPPLQWHQREPASASVTLWCHGRRGIHWRSGILGGKRGGCLLLGAASECAGLRIGRSVGLAAGRPGMGRALWLLGGTEYRNNCE
jgi:hypothetical protein